LYRPGKYAIFTFTCEKKGEHMKTTIIALVAVAAFALVCCKEKPKNQEGLAPQGTASRSGMQVGASGPGNASESNPAAGLAPQTSEAPIRPAHKGRVISTADAAGYTYIEMEENGRKLWAAVMETKVKQGDTVELPDLPPMENFYSKSLDRTFDRIIFSPTVAVNGRMQTAVVQPGRVSAANPHGGLKVEEVPAGAAMTQPGSPSAANPHGGLMPHEMNAGTAHKGRVVATMNAAGYTYIEVEENGKKLWAAVMETKVKAGDNVEFPDGPPMENFHSNSLNRTFERIIFSPAILVNGKPGNV
jgi:predicted RNase H-like HicB family nuclease